MAHVSLCIFLPWRWNCSDETVSIVSASSCHFPLLSFTSSQAKRAGGLHMDFYSWTYVSLSFSLAPIDANWRRSWLGAPLNISSTSSSTASSLLLHTLSLAPSPTPPPTPVQSLILSRPIGLDAALASAFSSSLHFLSTRSECLICQLPVTTEAGRPGLAERQDNLRFSGMMSRFVVNVLR